MIEEWRPVKGFEGFYEVSNLGRVKSLRKNIILKPELDKKGKGYLCINLGRGNHKKVHRLVAEAFIPKIADKNVVNHIDGNTKNNKVNNLEWVNHQENCLHYTYNLSQHKGQFKMKKVGMIGINNILIKEFPSISSAVRWLRKNTNFSKACSTCISQACKKHTDYSYGFKWEYREGECNE